MSTPRYTKVGARGKRRVFHLEMKRNTVFFSFVVEYVFFSSFQLPPVLRHTLHFKSATCLGRRPRPKSSFVAHGDDGGQESEQTATQAHTFRQIECGWEGRNKWTLNAETTKVSRLMKEARMAFGGHSDVAIDEPSLLSEFFFSPWIQHNWPSAVGWCLEGTPQLQFSLVPGEIPSAVRTWARW